MCPADIIGIIRTYTGPYIHTRYTPDERQIDIEDTTYYMAAGNISRISGGVKTFLWYGHSMTGGILNQRPTDTFIIAAWPDQLLIYKHNYVTKVKIQTNIYEISGEWFTEDGQPFNL
jgi:hypothetical protein